MSDRRSKRTLSLSLRITAILVLAVFSVGPAGCESAPPWDRAEDQLKDMARDVAQKAERSEADYFRGLTPARERIPDLMGQIARSGLATNYAEHLKVESDTDATLVYRNNRDVNPPTHFSIQLSLVQGKLRVDQIIIGELNPDVSGGPGTSSPEAVTSSDMTTTAQVFVGIASRRLVAGSDQSAFISYVNMGNEAVSLSQPPNWGVVIVAHDAGQVVSEWAPSKQPGLVAVMRLAPLQSAYGVVRFTVPDPARYLLYGRAFGVLSPPVDLQTVEKDES